MFWGEEEVIQGKDNTILLLKQADLALSDPTMSIMDHWTASCMVTGHLVSSIQERI